MKSLRRVMTPRADGTFLVPSEFVEKFKDIHGGGRSELISLWNKSNQDKDYNRTITLYFVVFGVELTVTVIQPLVCFFFKLVSLTFPLQFHCCFSSPVTSACCRMCSSSPAARGSSVSPRMICLWMVSSCRKRHD